MDSVHEGKKPFKCNLCDASFAEKCNLKKHVSTVHEGKKPFKCDICKADFTSKQIMNTHISSVFLMSAW